MLEEIFETWTDIVCVEEIPAIFNRLEGLLWSVSELLDTGDTSVAFEDWCYLAGMMDKEIKRLLDSNAVGVQFKVNVNDIKVIACIKDVEAFDEWVVKQSGISKEAIDNRWRHHMLGRITRCFYDAVYMLWNKEVCLLRERDILKKAQTLIDRNLQDLKGMARKTLDFLKGYEAVLDRIENSISNGYKGYLHNDIRRLLDEDVIRCEAKLDKEDCIIEVITYIWHKDAFIDYATHIGLGYEDVKSFLKNVAWDIMRGILVANAYNWWSLSLRKEKMLRR